jgi:hypothetical protein
MIGSLLKRDPTLRLMGRWMAMSVLSGTVVANIRLAVASGAAEAPGATSTLRLLTVLILWLPVCIYSILAGLEKRCHRVDLTLPISGRSLWLSHTLALAASTLGVLAATAAIAAFAEWGFAQLHGSGAGATPGGVVPIALKLGSVALLATVGRQATSRSTSRLSRTAPHVCTSVLFAAGILVATLLLDLAPLPLALAPLAAAAALLLAVRRSVEPALVLSPAHAGTTVLGLAPDGRTAWTGAARPARSPWLLVSTVYRSVSKMPASPLLGFPFVFLMGAVVSGYYRAWRGEESLRFLMVVMAAYMLMAFTVTPPRRLFAVDAFPVRRRLVFAVLILPLILVFSMGYAAGRAAADARQDERELVQFVEIDCCHRTRVPVEYTEVAWDGRPPRITSPWGETAEPWSARLYQGSRVTLYSPFSVGETPSIDFVALQLSRAVEAVYGTAISPDDIRDRFLVKDEQGLVRPRGGELKLRSAYPHLRAQERGPVFPTIALAACGLWLLVLSVYLRTLRAGVSERTKRRIPWIIMAVLLGVHLLQFALAMADVGEPWIIAGFLEIVIARAAEALPGGSLLIWVVCGLLLAAIYRLAERQFERVESLPGDDLGMRLILFADAS